VMCGGRAVECRKGMGLRSSKASLGSVALKSRSWVLRNRVRLVGGGGARLAFPERPPKAGSRAQA